MGEIQRAIQILCRRSKNNPCLIGEPGVGKTAIAEGLALKISAGEVPAKIADKEIHLLDLTALVAGTQFRGQFESRVKGLVDEIKQAGNVILFIDEADSLFGKRTEVKDSNDKYANQETSYILQRIESYEGMIILATNFAKNFDSAFMRRITVSIRFSEPNEEMRKLLWKDMLANTALAGDDILVENLAKQFELTGSNIKNIVRNALFLSFMEQRELRIEDIAKAVKVEFEKLGKIPNLSGFGMFFTYL